MSFAFALMVVVSGCGGGATSVAVLSVTVDPSGALVVGIGETLQYTAVGRDAAGGLVSGSRTTWSVADALVAEISSTGLLTAKASGTTSVTASMDGVAGSQSVEVFVPSVIDEYEVGVSYSGRAGYVEYIPGDLPVVLSAPHGGDFDPNEIPDRTFGVTGSDRNTVELTLAISEAIQALTGHTPHVILSHLHRKKLDPNREIVEAAQESAHAEQAWHEFQDWIGVARTTVEQEFGRGMYFDMHGHGHDVDRLELGYLLSASVLNGTNPELDALSVVAASSVRDLGRDSPIPFSQLLRGPTSFGGFLLAEGVRAVPSPSDPSPGSDAYFSGGYNTRTHGSRTDGEVISGIQIEHQFPGLRDTDANRRLYSDRLAVAIQAFMLEHFGFFEPG